MDAPNDAHDPARPPLTDEAPPDRYCDLVMKGGVTSGVVYPRAIVRLSRDWRFNRIGGTSVGAIAAALTAAAELQRREGSMAGFEALDRLPELLSAPVGPQTRLGSLFQPEPATRRLFRALFGMLNRESGASRLSGALTGAVREWWPAALIGGLAGLAVGAVLAWLTGSTGPLGPGLVALIGAVVGIGTGIRRDVGELVGQGFGLCRGRTVDADHPALVPWLHGLIQQLAGRASGDAPLTFKDLWTAPGFPPSWLPPDRSTAPGQRPAPSIDLQLFTTNLSQGRPWLLPVDAEASRLYYRRSELAPCFPDDVMAHLDTVARTAPHDPVLGGDADLRRLPMARLPVIIAVRMSLSFPLLLSAMPLWAIDDTAPEAAPRLRRCWFSDGGICSNFPMHLFDSFVPKWPTFGIDLGEAPPDAPGRRVTMPAREAEGGRERWDLAWRDDLPPWQALYRFLASVVGTAQTWNDTTSRRLPGVRDRIVQIDLAAGDGGLNINMDGDRIQHLAALGDEAGRMLVERFAGPDGRSTPAWDAHRWVRVNTLLVALGDRVRGIGTAMALDRHSTPVDDLIERARTEAPLSGAAPISAAQAADLVALLAALEAVEAASAATTGPPPYQPAPRPELKVRAAL